MNYTLESNIVNDYISNVKTNKEGNFEWISRMRKEYVESQKTSMTELCRLHIKLKSNNYPSLRER